MKLRECDADDTVGTNTWSWLLTVVLGTFLGAGRGVGRRRWDISGGGEGSGAEEVGHFWGRGGEWGGGGWRRQ